MAAQSYNFFGQSPGQLDASQSPQMLAQQMALQEYNNPTSQGTSSSSASSPSVSPQALAKMMQSKQFDPNYTDSAGVSGNTLNQYGIAPGQGGNLFGLNGMSMFGGAGNPLNLSSGSQFSPSDMTALKGAFYG